MASRTSRIGLGVLKATMLSSSKATVVGRAMDSATADLRVGLRRSVSAGFASRREGTCGLLGQ